MGAPAPRRRSLGVVSGVLGGLATGAFLLATQSGFLTVTAVLASLYPAFTVILAATVLREHIHRHQAVGLAALRRRRRPGRRRLSRVSRPATGP